LGYLALLAFAAVAIVSVIALREARLRTAALEAESRLVNTRYGSMEYAVWGEGPPVLVVHGAGGGFDQGRLLAEALGGDRNKWISVSRFGYLRSELADDRSPVHQAHAFADLLDELNLPTVSVMAMSGGVPPALQLGELYPDRVASMVLLSSAPFTPFSPDVQGRPIPSWVYELLLGNDVVYWLLTRVARGSLEQAFDARKDLREDLSDDEEAFISQLVDGFLPGSRRVAGVRNEIAAVDPDLVYRLEAIEAPTLVIHARDDRLNPFAVAEAIADGLPNARLVSLEDGGHLLLRHHAEVRQLTTSFLSDPVFSH
jgi:pimeloyl-ACP methyl ester carboxylesterase